eukprot:3325129-Rhodomonas_salina.2
MPRDLEDPPQPALSAACGDDGACAAGTVHARVLCAAQHCRELQLQSAQSLEPERCGLRFRK